MELSAPLFVFPYTQYLLAPAHPSYNAHRTRYGVLLKIMFESVAGYADCSVWPELGDMPLKDLLQQPHHLAPWIELAKIDAAARQHKRHLITEVVGGRNHRLLLDRSQITRTSLKQFALEGFTHLKYKVDNLDPTLSEQILRADPERYFSWRLDCNEKFSERQFLAWGRLLDPVRERIDFIEDPFPFEPESWLRCAHAGWNFAADRQARVALCTEGLSCTIICKPHPFFFTLPVRARFSRRMIVTSNLAHPVDQIMGEALREVIDPENKETHGLLAHLSYEKNLWNSSLCVVETSLQRPEGTGCGWNALLDTLPWRPLHAS